MEPLKTATTCGRPDCWVKNRADIVNEIRKMEEATICGLPYLIKGN